MIERAFTSVDVIFISEIIPLSECNLIASWLYFLIGLIGDKHNSNCTFSVKLYQFLMIVLTGVRAQDKKIFTSALP